MIFEPELLAGRLKERRKRFFADILLDTGESIVAHCPNPGSMKGSANAGSKVFVRELPWAAGRKLSHRWVLVEREAQVVCIDTLIANDLAAEALSLGLIPSFCGQRFFSREFAVDDSRFDFLLQETGTEGACVLEVKSVSLIEGGVGYFPDSPTERGRKHLQKLMELQLSGQSTALLFLVQAEQVTKFCPADDIDPEYGSLLREAVDVGVRIVACTVKVNTKGIWAAREIPIDLVEVKPC